MSRSADQFLINENTISSLYEADVILCDLSGEKPNPNVMFELGVRLAVSNGPVIMFRETHPSNDLVFNVSTCYIHPYSPVRYAELETFLIDKLRQYEDGNDEFRSPVLKTLEHAPSIFRRIREAPCEWAVRGYHEYIDALLARIHVLYQNPTADHRASMSYRRAAFISPGIHHGYYDSNSCVWCVLRCLSSYQMFVMTARRGAPGFKATAG